MSAIRDLSWCILWVILAFSIILVYMGAIGILMMVTSHFGLWSLSFTIPLGLGAAASMFILLGKAMCWCVRV